LIEANVGALRAQQTSDPSAAASGLIDITDACLRAELFSDAERYAREVLDILESFAPENISPGRVQSRLGAALVAQRKLAEAEPLLLAGARVLLAESEAPPFPVPHEVADAIQRLVDFYELTEQPEELDAWRSQLEELPALRDRPSSNREPIQDANTQC
jgi:hypothetical protein